MHSFFSTYKKPIARGLLAGFAVIVLLLMFSDIKGVLAVFSSLNWVYLPAILALAPLNYILRYIKWSYYLKLAGLSPEPRLNRLIFASGLSMTVTPAKVGELLKCYLLKEHMGAPVSTTSSIVMSERITDGLAMVILAAIGSLAFPYGRFVLLFAAAAVAVVIACFRTDALFQYLLGRSGRIGLIKKSASFLLEFQQNTKKLFSLPALAAAAAIGVVSWGFEGLVIYLAVQAFGGQISILASIFVVSFSAVAGALSLLPGGLLVAEGSIMALLFLIGLPKEMAAATTIVTRFSTLWLGVAVGLAALYLTQKELLK